eukprot:2638800-Alexandrium_andersonii.AAC.1
MNDTLRLGIDGSRRPDRAMPGAGGTARNAAPPSRGTEAWGSPTFADSEPRRGPFGPLHGPSGPLCSSESAN